MTVSAEERAANSRRPGARSLGPKDTSRSRFNALKHGLRAGTVALPGEDPRLFDARLQDYLDYYRPESPLAQRLAGEVVRAELQVDRVYAYQDATAAARMEEVQKPFDDLRAPDLRPAGALLEIDPAAARAALDRTASGRLWQAERWGQLGEVLEQDRWTETETARAIRLLGCPPEADELAKHPAAWTAGVLGAIAEGRSEIEVSEFFFGPLGQPPETARQYRHDALPDFPEAHRRLGRLIASEETAHRKAAALMQPGGRAAAAARAFLPEDERTARLFLRYSAEARSALYRAIKAFTAALDRERRGLDPGYDEAEPVVVSRTS
jgi:hypothetical protein